MGRRFINYPGISPYQSPLSLTLGSECLPYSQGPWIFLLGLKDWFRFGCFPFETEGLETAWCRHEPHQNDTVTSVEWKQVSTRDRPGFQTSFCQHRVISFCLFLLLLLLLLLFFFFPSECIYCSNRNDVNLCTFHWYYRSNIRNNNNKFYLALYSVNIYKLATLYIINNKIMTISNNKKAQVL